MLGGRPLTASMCQTGGNVRNSNAAYVKPFVRRNKNDARDAGAICAALGRPDMRFVPIKSVAQQASRGLEEARELLIKQHTQLRNCVRGQLAEFGISSPRRGGAASPRSPPGWRTRRSHRCRALPSGSAASWRAGRVKVAVLAQAAKTARIAWAVLVSGKPYQAPAAA